MALFKNLAIAFGAMCATLILSNATIAEDSLAPTKKALEEEQSAVHFQIIAVGDQAIMFDPKAAKTWILRTSGIHCAWLPIEKMDSAEEADSWCRDSGFYDLLNRDGGKPRTRLATLQKVVEASEPNLPIEGMLVAIARERAALRRLMAEFGTQHPDVLKSRERLRELLEVHELGVRDNDEPATMEIEATAGKAELADPADKVEQTPKPKAKKRKTSKPQPKEARTGDSRTDEAKAESADSTSDSQPKAKNKPTKSQSTESKE